jgi:anti-sigma B factor antagonist
VITQKWEGVMQLSERRVDGVSIIDVAGNLTVPENPRALRETVVALLHRGERRILLNVRKLQQMDSTCLGEIVASYTATTSSGGILKLEQTGPHLRRLLASTRLDTILESYDSEDEAIASFATPPRGPVSRAAAADS